jgi:hypothetical protein
MNKLHPVSEAEVIAGFLRNEFFQPDYDLDRSRFEGLVSHPDLNDPQHNALRRALLFRRRGHMWRELPADTQWWRVQLDAGDIQRLRIFPRAHWFSISGGDFSVENIVDRIRNRRYPERVEPFVQKIQSIRGSIAQKGSSGPVLIIGANASEPLVVLEGNHRVTAALLDSQQRLAALDFYCGLSPRMTECCWYRTNLPSLWRYLINRVRNVHDREADVERLMRETGVPSTPSAPGSTNDVGGSPWKADSQLSRVQR